MKRRYRNPLVERPMTTTDESVCVDPPIPLEYIKEWEEFFEKYHSAPSADEPLWMQTLYRHEAIYKTGLFPLQYKNELKQMLKIGGLSAPKTIMEIGCDKCGGVYHWCLIPSVERVIGCEIRGTPFSSVFEKNFPDIDFCWVDASRSERTMKTVKDFLAYKPIHTDPLLNIEHQIDILFIDGDKCFYTEDFDTYLPLMNPNGIVFMHDVSHSYPAEVFDKIRERGYRTEYVRDTSEYHTFANSGKIPETAYEHWLMYWRDMSCGVGVVYLDGDTSPKLDKVRS